MKKRTSVSLVIPCYNEEDGIDWLFKNLEKLCKKNRGRYSFEVLIINDGSTDKTRSLLKVRIKGRGFISVVDHRRNMGVGQAMRTGFSKAKGSVVVCYDADCTYPVLSLILIDCA